MSASFDSRHASGGRSTDPRMLWLPTTMNSYLSVMRPAARIKCSSWCRSMPALFQCRHLADDGYSGGLWQHAGQWRCLPQLFALFRQRYRPVPIPLLQNDLPFVHQGPAARVSGSPPSVKGCRRGRRQRGVLFQQSHSFRVHQQALIVLRLVSGKVGWRGRFCGFGGS